METAFIVHLLRGRGMVLSIHRSRAWHRGARCLRVAWGVPAASSVVDHSADRLAFVHQVERFVDALQRQGMGDKGIELNVATHRVFHHARELGASFHPAKGRATPYAASHELERSRADLLACAGDTDDDAFAP